MFYGSQKLYCPAHPNDNGFLGNRRKELPITLTCDECKFDHFFPPFATTPTKSTPIKKVGKICTCPSCRARDSKEKGEI